MFAGDGPGGGAVIPARPVPSITDLALTVTAGPWVSLDHWETKVGCMAWIEVSDRRCGKTPAEGYLCTRHHTVAVRRWEKDQAKQAVGAEQAAQRRAAKLPGWRAELAKVQAEIRRLDPPTTMEAAAFLGDAHPSITRRRGEFLSDSRVQRMAALWDRHQTLTRLIGETP